MSVASPCIGVCRIDHSRLCAGCHRSLDEIAIWSRLDDVQKAAVVQTAASREAKQAASPEQSPTASGIEASMH